MMPRAPTSTVRSSARQLFELILSTRARYRTSFRSLAAAVPSSAQQLSSKRRTYATRGRYQVFRWLVDGWWENNFLMIIVDKEGPIIGYGKETLLCRLALDEGWFLPSANEAVPKTFRAVSLCRIGFRRLISAMSFWSAGSMLARTESCLQVYRP